VDQRSTSRWFDVSAFSAPAAGRFGTAAKGVIHGPGSQVVNVGLAKHFSVGERARIRWEITATNFFNTPNYNNPNTNIVNVAGVGVITGAGGELDLDAEARARSERDCGWTGRRPRPRWVVHAKQALCQPQSTRNPACL
jgi:hypothetical protein